MALKSGLNDQFGFEEESVYGTSVTPTKFIDFVSTSINYSVERVESKAIRAGQRIMRSDDWAAGKKFAAGDVELELWNKSFGKIFGAMIGGTVATVTGTGAASGTYTHTYTPGDLPSQTLQLGLTDVGGTVRKFNFTGAMVDSWELSSKVGDPVNLKLSYTAQNLTTTGSVTAASYATGVELLTFVGASLSVSGNAVPVESLTLSGKNGLDAERFFLGAQTMSQPLEAELREITGQLEAEFTDLTLFGLYTAGTEVALVATFAGVTNPLHKLVVTTNVRFDGDTPVAEAGITKNPMKFKVVATGADSTAVSFAYTTSDATP